MKTMLAGLAILTVLGADAQDTDRVESLIEQLASDSFVDRELAADELEFDSFITLEDLEGRLHREDLNPEQRLRLLRAAMVRFTSEPRAAMGISLSNDVSDLGLKIERTFEGFDASGKLHSNDIVTEINHWPVRSLGDLQVAIISRSPGEIVPVVFLREGRQITESIQLGAWATLADQGGTPLGRPALAMAWRHRSREYAQLGAPAMIDLDSEPVARNNTPVRPLSVQNSRRESNGEPLRRMVVVGGEARPRPGSLARVRLDRPLSRSARDRASDFPPQLREFLTLAEVDIIAMQERIRRIQLQIDTHTKNGARRQLIEQAKAQLESYQASLAEFEKKADRLRNELDGLGVQTP